MTGCNKYFNSFPQHEESQFIPQELDQKRKTSIILFKAYEDLIQKAVKLGMKQEQEIFNHYIQEFEFLRKDELFIVCFSLIYRIMQLEGKLE